ncbi:hypothetical protein Zmor_024700 [Zophobas morio]|uniref:Uncharacterized protein n=1 Tax=Zophobas morio TaxID=2755281 RepID=A0AA38M8B9_9CUCU|nr:hypothetical protein Zmor_024700 [Zophobas morio]
MLTDKLSGIDISQRASTSKQDFFFVLSVMHGKVFQKCSTPCFTLNKTDDTILRRKHGLNGVEQFIKKMKFQQQLHNGFLRLAEE